MTRRPPPPPYSPPDLTAAILARTSGPACGRLRALACDLVDGTLPAGDADLARGHLTHCPDCRGLVARLEATGPALPAFAEVDPGAGFTASVLDRTRSARPIAAPPRDPLLDAWARLMRRPRAALEAAYLATAAGLILTQVPLPGPQRQAGSALVALVRTGSRASLARAASRGRAWTIHVRASEPVRILHRPEGVWSLLWSRLATRFSHAWEDLARAARGLRTRIWTEAPGPLPKPAEPSDPSPRPAP